MHAQPQHLSTISLKFGNNHHNLTKVFNFRAILGNNQVNNLKDSLKTKLNIQLQQSGAIFTTNFHGDITALENYFKNLQQTHNNIQLHKQSNTLTLVVNEGSYPDSSIGEYNQQLPENKNSVFFGSLLIDKQSDLSSVAGLFNNAELQINFGNSKQVLQMVEKLMQGLQIPGVQKMFVGLRAVNHMNLKINCGSGSLVGAFFKRYEIKIAEYKLWRDMDNVDKEGKGYIFLCPGIAIEADVNFQTFVSFYEMVKSLEDIN